MKTAEDTFKALKKVPFDEMLSVFKSIINRPDFWDIRDKYLRDRGWEPGEFTTAHLEYIVNNPRDLC